MSPSHLNFDCNLNRPTTKRCTIKHLENQQSRKATIKKWVTLIQTLPKIQSKQSLITLVYDYNLNDIEILLSLHHLLKQNGLTTANHLIINEISIREAMKNYLSIAEKNWQ